MSDEVQVQACAALARVRGQQASGGPPADDAADEGVVTELRPQPSGRVPQDGLHGVGAQPLMELHTEVERTERLLHPL